MLKFNPCHRVCSWEGPLWEVLLYNIMVIKSFDVILERLYYHNIILAMQVHLSCLYGHPKK